MTSVQTLIRNELRRDDTRLDSCLRRQVGITVETYKALRFGLRVLGIGIIAAPAFLPRVQMFGPTTVLVIAALVLGPDVAEAYLTRGK